MEDGSAEIVFAGGGTGIAPLYSHVRHLFDTCRTARKISLWVGFKSGLDMIYGDALKRLASARENFSFHVVLSNPEPAPTCTTISMIAI